MKRREYITPDITPLIDIVFLLLIFFLVSSVFKKEEIELQIDLPYVKGKTIEQKTKTLTISLKDKKIFIKKKLITIPIEKALLIYPKDSIVYVYIDKKTSYENILPLLNTINKLGFQNLNLMGIKGDD